VVAAIAFSECCVSVLSVDQACFNHSSIYTCVFLYSDTVLQVSDGRQGPQRFGSDANFRVGASENFVFQKVTQSVQLRAKVSVPESNHGHELDIQNALNNMFVLCCRVICFDPGGPNRSLF
jgi:hypothetical protein